MVYDWQRVSRETGCEAIKATKGLQVEYGGVTVQYCVIPNAGYRALVSQER
jgi:hypothetical protein